MLSAKEIRRTACFGSSVQFVGRFGGAEQGHSPTERTRGAVAPDNMRENRANTLSRRKLARFRTEGNRPIGATGWPPAVDRGRAIMLDANFPLRRQAPLANEPKRASNSAISRSKVETISSMSFGGTNGSSALRGRPRSAGASPSAIATSGAA